MSLSMASTEDQALLQLFLAKPPTKDSALESDSVIFPRILSLIIIGAISLWANHEASKGFSITIINEAKETPSGKRFSLFFESDDTAVRVLLGTSFFVERLLYEGVPHRLRKRVNHVTVRFYGDNSDNRFTVTSNASHGEYVISLSSSFIKTSEFRDDVEAALRRSMVRVWLWGDEESGASPELVAGLVEYLSERRRFNELGVYCYQEDKECVYVARWLDFCEGRSEGFIHGMRLGWDDRTVDLASNGACGSRKDVLRELKDGDGNGF